MITYKNKPIPIIEIAELRADRYSRKGDYELQSQEYKANVDYIQENPSQAVKWMFENTKPCDFGLSFDKWENLENFEIKNGEN